MSAPTMIGNFPVTPEMALVRRGTHFDIQYEVSNHGRPDDSNPYQRRRDGTWCYYVCIDERMLIDPADFEKFWLAPEMRERGGILLPSYGYMSAPFASADWHCGITFYEKCGGIDGEPRGVKMGCDYAHYWDEGREYDFSSVEFDVKRTINALREMYGFRRRCVWSGQWLPIEELTKDDRGNLYSPAAKAASDAARATGAAQ